MSEYVEDRFTEEELLIMDVALNEFIWSLDDELDSWDRVNGDGLGRDDSEWDVIYDMLQSAEEISDALQDILCGIDEYA